jgi:hypothetical protein
MGGREAIGETEFEQQILGYAPVEPDGSFKLMCRPTPLGFSVIDAKGRSAQTHLNWIGPAGRAPHLRRLPQPARCGDQLRHRRQRRAAAIMPTLGGAHQSGETMAALRTRLDPSALDLKSDLAFTDIWADTSKPGVTARASINVKYTGNANPADDLVTPAPSNGFINYPQHIAPIWTRSRGTGGATTCTNCHTDPVKLDLRADISGTGRVTSYEELLLGDPVIDPVTGQPQTRIEEGEPMIVRGPALVENGAGGAMGMARSSRLAEIMFGQALKASGDARTAHPNPPSTAPDHSTMLNAAERRLVTEWMDLGGQYVNNPADGGVRARRNAQPADFRSAGLPGAEANCVRLSPGRRNRTDTCGGASFRGNRFVHRKPGGDYNVTLSMISDTCRAASNYLLSRPSTVPHPRGATTRRRPCCRWAAPATRDSELDLNRMSDTLYPHPRRLRTRLRTRRHARRLRRRFQLRQSPVGREPTGRRRTEALLRLLRAASTRSSRRNCRSTRATSARSTPAPARAATTSVNGTGGSFGSSPTPRSSTSPIRRTRPT